MSMNNKDKKIISYLGKYNTNKIGTYDDLTKDNLNNYNDIAKQDILDFYNHYINDKYKNHLIIMDNARIHVSKIIRETIENDNNHLLYSVPYHPETNSIEEFFSQLKHYIKKESPNTYDNIYKVITNILEKKITKEHLTNYLKHSYKIYKS